MSRTDPGPKDLFRTTAPAEGESTDLSMRRIARSLGTRAVGIDELPVAAGECFTRMHNVPALEVRIYVPLTGSIEVRYFGESISVRLAPGTIETFPVVANASELEMRHASDESTVFVPYRWRNG
jgi:hypothetical protein